MMVKCHVHLAKRDQWYAIGSKLLRWFEDVPFSHCAIEIDGLIYESVYPESRVMRKSDWLARYSIVESFEKEISEELADEMEQWLSDRMLGKRYSVWALFVIAFTMSSKAIESSIIGREFDGSRSLICTELVGLWMIKFFNKKWYEMPDWLSLKDIQNGASEVFK
jgi:hypothetical protein